ncbi:MAG: hypothetical protein HGA45_34950 [Chloroflexales bacterium]|nr:hypothetical protein [Chloroflexales bacterium]
MTASHEEFLSALEAGLRAAEGVTSVAWDGHLFHVARSDGGQVQVNPFNFWRSLEVGLNTLPGVVERAVQTALESMGTSSMQAWSDLAERVFARLERRDNAERDGWSWRAWPPSRALRECLVEDRPTTMRRVLSIEIDAWGLTAEEVYARGRQNLWGLVQRGPRPRQMQPKLWLLDTDDGYGASRLLFPDWLERALPARFSRQGWIVAAPSRNVLLAMPVSAGSVFDLVSAGSVFDLVSAGTAIQQSYPNPWPSNAVLLRGSQLEPIDPLAGVVPVNAA